jgi:hypothetical protein
MKLKRSLVVIAGLDPAIQHNGAGSAAGVHICQAGAGSLDRRVKPGDDSRVVRSGRFYL